MSPKKLNQFVDSIFDERIWQMDDVEYQKEMVRLWIAMAYEEGRKIGKLEIKYKMSNVPILVKNEVVVPDKIVNKISLHPHYKWTGRFIESAEEKEQFFKR